MTIVRNPENRSALFELTTTRWLRAEHVYYMDINLKDQQDAENTIHLIFATIGEEVYSLPLRFFVSEIHFANINVKLKRHRLRIKWMNLLPTRNAPPPDMKISIIKIPYAMTMSVLENYGTEYDPLITHLGLR